MTDIYKVAFSPLQVFSRRFTYNEERSYFDIDPPLQSANLVSNPRLGTVLVWPP